MSEPIAEMVGLSISRETRAGLRPLVEDVSLSLAEGEICGVVGETGAGKTLTMKALLGLLPRGLRASGRVRIADDEVELDQSSPALLRRRSLQLAKDGGVVLQDPASMLDPLVRVGPQLIEGVLWHRMLSKPAALERADELLRAIGFTDPGRVMDLYPHQLSGGMAQRAAIAMALMTRPRVLVIDEPTSALDANVRLEVLGLVQALARQEGTAVLLVSHDLPLISRFSVRVLVMYAGRVVEQGPTAAVLARPRHPYTEALLSSAATVDSPRRQPLPTIPGTAASAENRPEGCPFQARCPHVFDRCRTAEPELRLVARNGHRSGHRAACYLVEE